ncbi:MAG: chaplin, partial [Catenulispora sp.]|nr:chaplin [Catenulispora sp.]
MQSQVKRRIAFGLTTGGLLAGGGLGLAHADSGGTASGSTGTTAGGSPGVLSGNSVQVPLDIPINVCGVTTNVVGLLNPAAHNECSNSGGATASGGSGAGAGTTGGSPGVLSGNNVEVPVNVPVNVCGDSVSGVGVGD